MSSRPSQPDETPEWERRYRTPRYQWLLSGRDNEDHSIYVSNETGKYQIYGWDRKANRRWKLTDFLHGTTVAEINRRGDTVWVFEQDKPGNYFGFWRRMAFRGGEVMGLAGLPYGKPRGAVAGNDLLVIGTSDAGTDHQIYSWQEGKPPTLLFNHRNDVWIKALSSDDKYAAIEHALIKTPLVAGMLA